VIVSQSVAQRMFPNQDAVGHHLMWSDPVMKFIDVSTGPRRIVGVSADMDDERVVPGPAMTVYHPFEQEIGGGRLFVHTHSNPYSLVTPITHIVRDMSVDQPVEHAATLEDVRAEVLTPNRLNALVFGVFAAVALAIAVIGVAGVLVFSVSGRTREFGIRLALGAQPQNLLKSVIAEGAVMAAAGILAGGILGYALARLASGYVVDMRMPDFTPVLASAGVLLAAAVMASFLPAARAARIDVMEALRSE
jgi:putative ABC transport system permease protein